MTKTKLALSLQKIYEVRRHRGVSKSPSTVPFQTSTKESSFVTFACLSLHSPIAQLKTNVQGMSDTRKHMATSLTEQRETESFIPVTLRYSWNIPSWGQRPQLHQESKHYCSMWIRVWLWDPKPMLKTLWWSALVILKLGRQRLVTLQGLLDSQFRLIGKLQAPASESKAVAGEGLQQWPSHVHVRVCTRTHTLS